MSRLTLLISLIFLSCVAQAQTASEWVGKMKSELGVTVYIDSKPPHMDAGSASGKLSFQLLPPEDYDDLYVYLGQLYNELRKYSKTYLTNLGFGILICRDLRESGTQMGAKFDVPAFAVSDYESGVVVFDYAQVKKAPLEYWQDALHHELGHYAISTLTGSPVWHDEIWESFNPPDFHYGKGGVFYIQEGKYGDYSHPHPGFVSDYCTSGVEEDMAEVAGALRTPRETRLLDYWRKSDRLLDGKVQRMSEILASLEKPLSRPADSAQDFRDNLSIGAVYESRASVKADQTWTASYDVPKHDSTRVLARFMSLVYDEFSRLPTLMRQKLDLANIVFCSNLDVEGRDNTYPVSGRRSSWYDPDLSQLYLDVEWCGTGALAYQEHSVQFAILSYLAREQDYRGWDEEGWKALNEQGFVYGRSAMSGYNGELVHQRAGFIDRYSEGSAISDAMELLAAVQVPLQAKLIETWRASDPILDAKIRKAQEFLNTLLNNSRSN